jgi:hypothetical protein
MEEMGWDDWLLYHTRHLKMWNHWKVTTDRTRVRLASCNDFELDIST